MKRPSYWLTYALVGILASEQFHFSLLELVGAAFLWGFALAFLDEIVSDLWPRLFKPEPKTRRSNRLETEQSD